MKATSAKKQAPTNRCAARSRAIEPSASHHSRTQLEATSIIESAPNPIKATLPARIPTVTPIIASSDVQVILRYSTRRPARVCRERSKSSVMTVSCTSELNAIIVPCCLENSSPHARQRVDQQALPGLLGPEIH